MRVLYLTVNPNPGSTNQLLLDWLRIGQRMGMSNSVAVNSAGDMGRCMAAMGIAHRFSPMPLPDRWRPWNCLGPIARLAIWARGVGVDLIHCQEHDVYPFGRPLARLLGVPVVCHVRCMVERVFRLGVRRQAKAQRTDLDFAAAAAELRIGDRGSCRRRPPTCYSRGSRRFGFRQIGIPPPRATGPMGHRSGPNRGGLGQRTA